MSVLHMVIKETQDLRRKFASACRLKNKLGHSHIETVFDAMFRKTLQDKFTN